MECIYTKKTKPITFHVSQGARLKFLKPVPGAGFPNVSAVSGASAV